MIEKTVREVLDKNGRLLVSAESLSADDDLYRAGMSSQASVAVMLGLEDAFDIEFPDRLLTKRTFGTIASIAAAVSELGA